MKKKLIVQLSIMVCLILQFSNVLAQEKQIIPKAIPVSGKMIKDSAEATAEIPVHLQYTVFTEEEMKKQWKMFEKDKGWKELIKKTEEKGFKRIEKSSWGFSGKLTDPNTKKSEDVMFCAFDFYSPSVKEKKSFQTCSMIWRKVGRDLYKAYIVFPIGESSTEKSFDLAEEWFADAGGKVRKAHSFNKCFRKCTNGGRHNVSVETFFGKINVKADCKTSCLSGIAVCGGVTAILELATGGLGTPVLIATFGICAGVACGQCFAICALGCS